MRLLLVETTAYAPTSPLFLQACASKARTDLSFTYQLFDEAPYSMPWTFASAFLSQVHDWHPDVILFVGGQLVTRTLLERLHATTDARLICWQPDNPWNWKACAGRVQDCIPFYDVYLTCKTSIMDSLVEAGAQQVTYLACGYKPQIHFVDTGQMDRNLDPFRCDLAVIGGADDERIAVVKDIRHAAPELSMKLYGGYWVRDRELRPFANGIVLGWQYRAAIRCATICLNLLRTDNCDQHNMRTFEIPACGGTMLTTPTAEHHEIFGVKSPFYYTDIVELPDRIKQLVESAESARANVRHETFDAIQACTWGTRLEQLCAVLSSSTENTATSPLTT